LKFRDLRRRGGIVLGAAVLCVATFQTVGAQAQHQNILFATSDPGVLDKVLAAVKGSDPSGYRFDATIVDKGRTRHVTYGALPLKAVSQVNVSTFGGRIAKANTVVVVSSISSFYTGTAFERIREALEGVDTGLYTLKQGPAPKPAPASER
jgi:hypothetical protein